MEFARKKRIKPLASGRDPERACPADLPPRLSGPGRAGERSCAISLALCLAHFSVEDVDRLLSSLVSAGYLLPMGRCWCWGLKPSMRGRSNCRELFWVVPRGWWILQGCGTDGEVRWAALSARGFHTVTKAGEFHPRRGDVASVTRRWRARAFRDDGAGRSRPKGVSRVFSSAAELLLP